MNSEYGTCSNGTALARRQASVDSALTTHYSPFTIRRRKAASFTLIELLVAVGLMALLLTMIAQVFYQATRSFRMAKSSVEIHQNARAAFDIMLRDLAAAEFCSYEDKSGYFALSVYRDGESGEDVQAVTLTTLAEQSGAEPLVPGVSPQVALVRYTLQFDGGNVTLDGVQRSTYNLVKQVRFPQLVYPFMDMNEFDGAWTPDEIVTTDILALSVLSMRARIFYGGNMLHAVDFGRCTGGSDLTDANKNWPDLASGFYVRLLGGGGAPDASADITANSATVLTAPGLNSPTANETTYRIEKESAQSYSPPGWVELPDRQSDVVAGVTYADANMFPIRVIESVADVTGMTPSDIRMPYLIEVTLEVTDSRGMRRHTFTERFFIPSSEW